MDTKKSYFHIEGGRSYNDIFKLERVKISTMQTGSDFKKRDMLKRVGRDKFILCPIYYRNMSYSRVSPHFDILNYNKYAKDTLFPIIEDYQPQASEKVKKGESLVGAAQRCAVEELGLYFQEEHITRLGAEMNNGKRVTYFHMSIEKAINDSTIRSSIIEKTDVYKDNDESDTDKVVIYISINIANKTEVDNLYNRYRYKPEDCIEEQTNTGHMVFLVKIDYILDKMK